MKKFLSSLVLSLLSFALAPIPALAQNPCQSRGARMAKGATSGAVVGALVGGILKGGKGAGIGAGIGAGAGILANTRGQSGCQAAQAPRHEPFPERITSANQRSTMEEMPNAGVYIRQLQGGNQASLVGLLGPALDANGYSLVDGGAYRRNPEIADYLVDVTITQMQQGYNNSFTSIQGRGGNITLNPSNGAARFLVTVITYRGGKYDRNLSAVDLPVTVTQSGGSVQLSIRGRDGGFQTGSYGNTYTVDPYTAAAYQAITRVFNLR